MNKLRLLPIVCLPLALVASACTLETPDDAAPPETEEGSTGTVSEELRRSDFGQSRSISVRDQTGAWRSGMIPASHGTGTLTTASGALRTAGVTSIQALSWVGDANSYIDVFDQDFVSTQVWSPTSGGPQFARLRYPWPSNASFTFFLPFGGSPITTPRAFNAELPTGRAWKAFRHYERGECSAETSWPTFLGGLEDALTKKLSDGFARKGLTGATLDGDMVGTLQIVPDATGDIYRVRARYDVHRCSSKMDVGFALRIGTSERAPRVRLEGVPTVSFDFGDDACGGLAALKEGYGFDAGALQRFIEGEVRTELQTELAPSVQDAFVERLAQPVAEVSCRTDAACLEILQAGLRAGVGGRAPNPSAAAALAPRNAKCIANEAGARTCRFVPNVQRIHTRPDGMELVFSDLRSDPLFSLLAEGGVCSRAEPSSSAPTPAVTSRPWGPTRAR